MLYLGLCLQMWILQASLKTQNAWLALSWRPSVTHRAALVGRAASNLGATWPVCLQLHCEPACARQDQMIYNRAKSARAPAEAEMQICSQNKFSQNTCILGDILHDVCNLLVSK